MTHEWSHLQLGGDRGEGKQLQGEKKPKEIENALKALNSNSNTFGKGKQKLVRNGLSTVKCGLCHAIGHNKRHMTK